MTQASKQVEEIKIEIQKADTMREGFAAYHVGSYKRKGKPVVLLNVFATLGACIENNISIKQQVIECLMHEFGHVLEEFYDKEFDEEFIEGVVMSYREKYGGEQPNELITHQKELLAKVRERIEYLEHKIYDFGDDYGYCIGHVYEELDKLEKEL